MRVFINTGPRYTMILGFAWGLASRTLWPLDCEEGRPGRRGKGLALCAAEDEGACSQVARDAGQCLKPSFGLYRGCIRRVSLNRSPEHYPWERFPLPTLSMKLGLRLSTVAKAPCGDP